MEFKDLPSDIQRIAGHTLAATLEELGTDIKSEPAKELAHNIKAAFVALYSEDSAKRDSEESAAIAQAIAHCIAGETALRKLCPALALKGSDCLHREPVAGSGFMSQIDASPVTSKLKPILLPGELCAEIASQLLPVIRETISRRGLDGDYDYDVLLVLKTMEASLGI